MSIQATQCPQAAINYTAENLSYQVSESIMSQYLSYNEDPAQTHTYAPLLSSATNPC